MDKNMNGLLLDPIRHNNWATRRLVSFCQGLSSPAEYLTAPGVGTFGGIVATLNHLIRSDAHYVGAVLGSAPAWTEDDEDTDLDGLASRAMESERLWEQLLTGPIDVERVLVVDDGANEVHAGVFLAQTLNHGNLHREQVCVTLTGFGIDPPDIQAWEYAWTTGRIWKRATK